jgi:CheY-like chemotaxis protein
MERPVSEPKPAATIMWVDDDRDLLWLMARTLGRQGFLVKTFDHPPSWEQVTQSRPSVIFLDVDLGTEDGVEVCDAIKHDRRGRSIPVVLVSAQAPEKLRAAAKACGADGHVSKPFDPRRIVELAQHYAEQPAA